MISMQEATGLTYEWINSRIRHVNLLKTLVTTLSVCAVLLDMFKLLHLSSCALSCRQSDLHTPVFCCSLIQLVFSSRRASGSFLRLSRVRHIHQTVCHSPCAKGKRGPNVEGRLFTPGCNSSGEVRAGHSQLMISTVSITFETFNRWHNSRPSVPSQWDGAARWTSWLGLQATLKQMLVFYHGMKAAVEPTLGVFFYVTGPLPLLSLQGSGD